jgi:RNA-directed DNA polymerase
MYLLYGTIRLEVINHPLDGDWIYWSSKIGKYPGVRTRIAKLLKNQKNKCASCGLNFRPTDIIEVDHIVPRSVGGKDTYENIQLLHRHCHDVKTAEDLKAVNFLKTPVGLKWNFKDVPMKKDV